MTSLDPDTSYPCCEHCAHSPGYPYGVRHQVPCRQVAFGVNGVRTCRGRFLGELNLPLRARTG